MNLQLPDKSKIANSVSGSHAEKISALYAQVAYESAITPQIEALEANANQLELDKIELIKLNIKLLSWVDGDPKYLQQWVKAESLKGIPLTAIVDVFDKMWDEIKSLEAELDRLKEENVRLRDVLKPFE